jgi:hypothetical protein
MNVPAELLPLEGFYDKSRESFEDIVRYADPEGAACMSHSEFEMVVAANIFTAVHEGHKLGLPI